MEVIGYIGRAAASNATDQLGPYIIQSVLLLVPPSLFAASIYMTLGRIIRGLGPTAESCSLIGVNWLTRFFVLGDAFAFLVQATGAGMAASGDTMAEMGEHVVVGGLVIQVLFFGLFVAAAVVFQLRFQAMIGPGGAEPAMAWRGMMNMLYGASVLILARCVFRIVEYAMGMEAYLLTHEWTLYVFDGLLMVAVMVIFYWWYPSEIGRYQRSKGQDGVTISATSGAESRYDSVPLKDSIRGKRMIGL